MAHRSDPLRGLNMRLTYRTAKVIWVIAAEAGLSNAAVAERAGIADAGQISRLLARLAELGLIENIASNRAATAENSWRLTELGQQLESAVAREITTIRESRRSVV